MEASIAIVQLLGVYPCLAGRFADSYSPVLLKVTLANTCFTNQQLEGILSLSFWCHVWGISFLHNFLGKAMRQQLSRGQHFCLKYPATAAPRFQSSCSSSSALMVDAECYAETT